MSRVGPDLNYGWSMVQGNGNEYGRLREAVQGKDGAIYLDWDLVINQLNSVFSDILDKIS